MWRGKKCGAVFEMRGHTTVGKSHLRQCTISTSLRILWKASPSFCVFFSASLSFLAPFLQRLCLTKFKFLLSMPSEDPPPTAPMEDIGLDATPKGGQPAGSITP